jgi:glycosyltransferase involved in cell wall biosynthesis
VLERLGVKVLREKIQQKSVEFHERNAIKVDMMHLFNIVSFGQTPWIVTYETLVPRYRKILKSKNGDKPSFVGLRGNQDIFNAVKALASDKCKKLIAMSECSKRLQESFLDEFPDYKDSILKKIVVLYPPQRSIIKSVSEKIFDFKKINLMFVGTAFFRKGGQEIINVIKHNRIFRNKFHLVIVSGLKDDNYVGNVNQDSVEHIRKAIAENCEWIEFYPSLPNNIVLELMKRAHVGLLPTYADSFGYSVLEFQAAWCPVISTDVRALPEINNNEIGWLINVSKNRYGEAYWNTEEQWRILKAQIEIGLERVFSELCENPDVIYDKSLRSYNQVSQLCSMKSYAERLKEIYLSSLQ